MRICDKNSCHQPAEFKVVECYDVERLGNRTGQVYCHFHRPSCRYAETVRVDFCNIRGCTNEAELEFEIEYPVRTIVKICNKCLKQLCDVQKRCKKTQ